MMHFDRDWHPHASIVVSKLTENKPRNGFATARCSGMCEACEGDPGKRGVIDHIITHCRLQRTSSIAYFLNCLAHVCNKPFKVVLVIEIRIGKAIVRQ